MPVFATGFSTGLSSLQVAVEHADTYRVLLLTDMLKDLLDIVKCLDIVTCTPRQCAISNTVTTKPARYLIQLVENPSADRL